MTKFVLKSALLRLRRIDSKIAGFAEVMTEEWDTLSRNNQYWARVLVASVIAEKYIDSHRGSLRQIGRHWLPKKNRCYNGHLLPKGLQPYDCPKCDP